MALKTYNPTSAGQRHKVMVDRSHLWKGKPVKTLTEGLTKSGGRGNSGRITNRAIVPHEVPECRSILHRPCMQVPVGVERPARPACRLGRKGGEPGVRPA